MQRRRSAPILVSFVLSLLVTIALLVVWVIYVVRASTQISELAARLRVSGSSFSLVMLTVGCVLFFLLIVGITYQLALALAARRYSLKQEEFVSNITHELKSPLAAIKLHGQTLQQEELTAEERQRSLRFILEQADRMGGLVDNVLESSRMQVRRQPLDLQPIALAPFFQEYFEEARKRIEAQGIRLEVRLETDAAVSATPDALFRVLNNLLDNAVRFSAKGGEVRCLASEVDDLVFIQVEDDGIGIPNKELPKVFDRFYQISREIGGKRHGSGLGLFIVSQLVQAMGGSIHAHSQEGRPGTRFVVELPRLEGAA